MAHQLAVVALCSVMFSCSPSDLAGRCATALAASARASNLEVRATGNRVIFEREEFELDVRIENEGRRASQWLVGIAVTVTSTSGGRLVAGSVGVGTDRTDALDTAVDEWVQLAGVAIVRGVVLKERSSERYELPGLVAYPGATGFRGAEEVAWSTNERARLLELLAPLLGHLDPGRLHSISLTLQIDANQAVGGDCRLDDTASPELLQAAKQFQWPVGSYIFKQYYVVQVLGSAA